MLRLCIAVGGSLCIQRIPRSPSARSCGQSLTCLSPCSQTLPALAGAPSAHAHAVPGPGPAAATLGGRGRRGGWRGGRRGGGAGASGGGRGGRGRGRGGRGGSGLSGPREDAGSPSARRGEQRRRGHGPPAAGAAQVSTRGRRARGQRTGEEAQDGLLPRGRDRLPLRPGERGLGADSSRTGGRQTPGCSW